MNGHDVVMYVDAGYVRQSLRDGFTGTGIGIDTAIVAAILHREAARRLGRPLGCQHWYDGVSSCGLSPRQLKLASTEGVVLRQGLLVADSTRTGYRQKAVDTLLVRDMVVDAIGGRITDMVLCSGDADMIPGVREAIDHGVRVHLWGIGATAERAYARSLQAEVDDSDTLDPSLFEAAVDTDGPTEPSTPQVVAIPISGRVTPAAMPRAVAPLTRPAWVWHREDVVELPTNVDHTLGPYQLGRHYGRYWYTRTSDDAQCAAAALTTRNVPTQLDGALLTTATTVLQPPRGILTAPQRVALRQGFVSAATECADSDLRSPAEMTSLPPVPSDAMFH